MREIHHICGACSKNTSIGTHTTVHHCTNQPEGPPIILYDEHHTTTNPTEARTTMKQRLTAWMEGCGHGALADGSKCRCRLIVPILLVLALSIIIRVVVHRHW